MNEMSLRLEEQPVSPPQFYPYSRQLKEQTVPQKQTPQPNFDDLVTEDDEPVDNIFSEKQQRLLTESLYNSWQPKPEGRVFLTLANVGLFYARDKSPLVPDVLVSLDVKLPDNLWKTHNRSYFVSEYGKPPEVVIEIVSNIKGKEAGSKWEDYAKAGVRYYVIFDPERRLKEGVLRVYELHGKTFVGKPERWLKGVGLGLTLWKGRYENKVEEWLRWCDKNGDIILTGEEKADEAEWEKEQALQRAEQESWEKQQAQQQAEQERWEKQQAQQQAEQAQQQAEQERWEKQQAQLRADSLAAKLRALGIDPDKL
jgi:hypothetical protein